jgi:hypothetical protein
METIHENLKEDPEGDEEELNILAVKKTSQIGMPNLFLLWRPIFIIALYVVILWRDFICTEICGGHAKKSSKWF